MKKARTAQCAACGVTFECAPSGRKPRFCPDHQPKNGKKRREDRELARAGGMARHIVELERRDESHRAYATQLIAAGLTFTDDPKRAARMMGVPDDVDAVAVAEQARKRYAKLIAGDSKGHQQLGLQLASVAMAKLLPALNEMPVGQIAPTLKAVLDSIERLQSDLNTEFEDWEIVLTQQRPEPVPRPPKPGGDDE